VATSSETSGAGIRRGGNRRGATTTAGSWRLCVVCVVIGNKVARGTGQPSQAVKMETGRRQVGLAQQNIFSNFQTPLKLQIQKGSLPLFKKIFTLCMRLCLNILNNFLNWVNFKFSTEFML
jgi:hypothetical protein